MAQGCDGLAEALVGRYQLECELGRGGTATVYRARDLKHDRVVALKVLRPELAAALGTERFLREIRLTARLNHPHILPLLDSGEAAGLLFYVMPYVDGASLRDRLLREKQLPLDEALRIAREVADALSYAHGHDVLHRDIKPENVLLEAGHAVVTDFGIARAIAAAGQDPLTESGIAVGTPAYMSPEQAGGDPDLGARSDLYSLGCVLYEMLAGEPPFTGPSAQAVLARQTLDPVPPLSTVRKAVPLHVERAVLRALEKVPADRFPTPREFAAALDPAAPASSRRLRRAVGRLPWRILAGAGAIVAVAAAVWSVRQPWHDAEVELLPSRVAVFPFSVPGDARFADLGDGVMELVSAAIDGAGEVRRVDPNALLSRMRREGAAAPVDLVTARRLAREVGAGHFVLGRVVDMRGSMRMAAAIYATSEEDGQPRQIAHEGEVEELPELVDRLARDILLTVGAVEGEFSQSLRGASGMSFGAVREFLRGQAFMRRRQADSAYQAFQAAVQLDSTFALAWLRLAETMEWMGGADAERLERIRAAYEEARRYRHRLTMRERLLFEIAYAYAHGDGPRAEATAETMVAAFPDAVEGWRYLGDIRRDFAWQLGRSMTEAAPAYERALGLDPDNGLALNGLAAVRYVVGDKEGGDSLWARWTQGGHVVPPEDSVNRLKYFAMLESAPRATVRDHLWATSMWSDRLPDARRLATRLADPTRLPESDPALGRWMGALVQLARGRWEAADSEFTQAAAVNPGMGVVERAWFAAMPIFGMDSSRLRGLRDSLAEWAPPPAYRQAVFINDEPVLRWLLPHAKPYVLGLLSVRLGDRDAGLRYAALLERAREPADSIGLLADLALEIRALDAMERKDWASGLGLLERSALRSRIPGWAVLSAFHHRPLGRFLRAEALFQLGRYEEAAGWYGTFWWLGEFVWIAPVQRRLGEICERQGSPAEAIRHYRRFLARWHDADARYQPLIRETEARIDRLDAEGGAPGRPAPSIATSSQAAC